MSEKTIAKIITFLILVGMGLGVVALFVGVILMGWAGLILFLSVIFLGICADQANKIVEKTHRENQEKE